MSKIGKKYYYSKRLFQKVENEVLTISGPKGSKKLVLMIKFFQKINDKNEFQILPTQKNR